QNQSSLVITSQVAGTIVTPGQTIAVHVNAQGMFSTIGVLGSTPLDWANPVGQEFTLYIPQSIQPGQYSVTAVGKTSSGLAVFSKKVPLVVETSTQGRTLEVKIDPLVFDYI